MLHRRQSSRMVALAGRMGGIAGGGGLMPREVGAARVDTDKFFCPRLLVPISHSGLETSSF